MNRSEKIAIGLVTAKAIEVFGNEERASVWLNSVNLAFGDTPMSILDTAEGRNEVMKVLVAIAYGGVV